MKVKFARILNLSFLQEVTCQRVTVTRAWFYKLQVTPTCCKAGFTFARRGFDRNLRHNRKL